MIGKWVENIWSTHMYIFKKVFWTGSDMKNLKKIFFFLKKYVCQTLWGLTCKYGTLYSYWNIPFHYMSHLWGTHMDHSFRVKKSERSYRFWVKSKKDWCSCKLNMISTIWSIPHSSLLYSICITTVSVLYRYDTRIHTIRNTV